MVDGRQSAGAGPVPDSGRVVADNIRWDTVVHPHIPVEDQLDKDLVVGRHTSLGPYAA